MKRNVVIIGLFCFLALLILCGIRLNSNNSQVEAVSEGTRLIGKQLTFQTGREGVPRALVVYYPSQTSEEVALQMAKGIHDAGYDVIVDQPGPDLSTDLTPYNIVVLGSPVERFQVESDLINYVKRVGDFSGKKVILFSTGGLGIKKELHSLEKLLGGVVPAVKVKFRIMKKESNGKQAYEIGNQVARGTL